MERTVTIPLQLTPLEQRFLLACAAQVDLDSIDPGLLREAQEAGVVALFHLQISFGTSGGTGRRSGPSVRRSTL